MARKDDYKKGERFNDDMAPTFPDRTKIKCRDCALRKPGMLGEMNTYCGAYQGDAGKPYEVLFQNADCVYYAPEA